MLIGRVGQEPALRQAGGTCVVTLSLSTVERGYTRQDGTKVEDKTEWHRVNFWGKSAEIVSKYVHKGDKLYVDGKIQTNKYTDKQGVERESKEIRCEDFEFLTQKPQGGGNTGGQPSQWQGGRSQQDNGLPY